MDERKNRIEELEKNKVDSQKALDSLCISFGETLLGRLKTDSGGIKDAVDYLAMQKDIEASNTAINETQEKVGKLHRINDKINENQVEKREREDELEVHFRKLGKALMEDTSGSYSDFTASYRIQFDSLVTKVDSLEKRSADLDQNQSGNVFTWIGKNAQSLVNKSFLTRAQENLEQLYEKAGESFFTREVDSNSIAGSIFEENRTSASIAACASQIESAKIRIESLSKDIVSMEDEKREITDSFGVDGSPQKRIASLKNNIAHVKEDLAVLYRRIGAQAALPSMSIESTQESRELIETLRAPEDEQVIEKISQHADIINEYTKKISKLGASIDIDNEMASIDKRRKSIDEKKERIAEIEKQITVLEEGIHDSEKYIEDLRKLL